MHSTNAAASPSLWRAGSARLDRTFPWARLSLRIVFGSGAGGGTGAEETNVRKLVQRRFIAGLGALALACGAVIALGQSSSRQPKMVTSVFPPSAPAAADP